MTQILEVRTFSFTGDRTCGLDAHSPALRERNQSPIVLFQVSHIFILFLHFSCNSYLIYPYSLFLPTFLSLSFYLSLSSCTIFFSSPLLLRPYLPILFPIPIIIIPFPSFNLCHPLHSPFSLSLKPKVTIPQIDWQLLLGDLFNITVTDTHHIYVHFPEHLTKLCTLLDNTEPW